MALNIEYREWCRRQSAFGLISLLPHPKHFSFYLRINGLASIQKSLNVLSSFHLFKRIEMIVLSNSKGTKLFYLSIWDKPARYNFQPKQEKQKTEMKINYARCLVICQKDRD